MATTSTPSSLSFKPWTRNSDETNALKDVLQRVNIERGHFRDITEASLQEELATEGAIESSESDEDEEDEENKLSGRESRPRPTTREELYNAKQELLGHIVQAEQDVLMSLDCISLLQSQRSVNPAATTISPFLRSNVPVGSLGTDVWRTTPVDQAREAQDQLISMNVRMNGLQDSADTLLAAASRLKENVKDETQYWQQILSVSQRGWSISKIPRTEHMLGVHFGFGGSAPEFARRDLAALTADADGNITLERGIGSKAKAVLATVRKQGKVVGMSRLPSPPGSGDNALESRIRYARDSVYDEELFHEMIREGRVLASQGISMRGSAISFAVSSDEPDDQTISFELIALDDSHRLPAASSNEFDSLARASLLATRLLLGQAHRERLKKKAEIPSPMTERNEEKPLFPILRPLMLLLQHDRKLKSLNVHFTNLEKLLRKASVTTTFRPFLHSVSSSITDSPTAESLIALLLRPDHTTASFIISTPDEDSKPDTEDFQSSRSATTFDMTIESSLVYSFGALYSFTMTDSKTTDVSSINSSTLTASSATISETSPSQPQQSSSPRPYRFSTAPEFLRALDDFLGVALTQLLCRHAGVTDLAAASRRVAVEVRGKEGVLRIRETRSAEVVEWDVQQVDGGNGEDGAGGKRFWESGAGWVADGVDGSQG